MSQSIEKASRPGDDIITIIAPTLDEVMQRYRARGLAAAGYTITGQARRHHFEMAGESGGDLFDGATMIAATFRRAD